MTQDAEPPSGSSPQGPADPGERPCEPPGDRAGQPRGARPGERPDEDTARAPDGDRGEDAERARFADATADPLAGVFGSSASAGGDQAYRIGVGRLQSGGSATLVGGGSFGSFHVGDVYQTAALGEQATGSVRAEVLEDLAERYTPVASYAALLERLGSTRLLALRGVPGTGRRTTGLRLLAQLTYGKVSRFDPQTNLRSLTEHALEAGTGYLLELAPSRDSLASVAVHLDRIRGLLSSRECFMVLIVPNDPRYQAALSGYVADCPAPEPTLMFDRVIDRAASEQPELASDLHVIARKLRPEIPQIALPSEVLSLAGLAVAHAAGEITYDQMLQRGAESLDDLVAKWFENVASAPATAEGDDEIRLAAFRIALAVFNEIPVSLVEEAGEILAVHLMKARSPRRNPGRPVFAKSREAFISNSRARLFPDLVLFGKASVSSTFVAYIDERMPAAIMHEVWNLHNFRAPLMEWLRFLCRDARPFIWMRAALAIGTLSSWDMAYTFHALIDPWASSSDDAVGEQRQRFVAAVALDAAGHNDEVLPAVREIIAGWCRDGSQERRWTGAAALGYDLGAWYAAQSLKDLRVAGCWEDGRLAHIATWAVARIFTRGAIEPTLAAVDRWLADNRRVVRNFGLLVALRIASLTVADLDDIGMGGELGALVAGRQEWPLFVALATEDPSQFERFVDIVWQTTRSLPARQYAMDVIARWIRATESDRSCAGPLGRFLALLGDDAEDRKRLRRLVETLRKDPDQPLPGDIADRLEHAIETNTHTDDEEWQ